MGKNYYIGSDDADEDDIIIPDIPTTIIGYRQWKFDPAKNELCSRVPWPKNDLLEAECMSYTGLTAMGGAWGYLTTPQQLSKDETHLSPSSPDEEILVYNVQWSNLTEEWLNKNEEEIIVKHPNPGCGIYSFNTFANLRLSPFYTHGVQDVVTGLIEMGGLVWPHERGWRAQYALVKAIYLVNKYDHEIAKLYSADIVVPETEDDYQWLMDKYSAERKAEKVKLDKEEAQKVQERIQLEKKQLQLEKEEEERRKQQEANENGKDDG